MTGADKAILGSWGFVALLDVVLDVQANTVPGGSQIPGGQPGAKVAPGGAELNTGPPPTRLPAPQPLVFSGVYFAMLYLLARVPGADKLAGAIAVGTVIAIVVQPSLQGQLGPLEKVNNLLSSMRQPSGSSPGG